MSKVVKGIKKGIKKIFKGIKKVFKKITKSTFGKIILGAALIYFGGAALGAWGGGGAAGTGGIVGSTATTGVTGAGAGVGGGLVSGTTTGAITTGAGTGLGGTIGGAVGGVGAGIAQGSATQSIWQTAVKSLGKFAASDTGKAAILGGIQAAATPDQADLMKEEEKIYRARLRRQNRNLEVGGLNVSFDVKNEGTGGIISSRLKGY